MYQMNKKIMPLVLAVSVLGSCAVFSSAKTDKTPKKQFFIAEAMTEQNARIAALVKKNQPEIPADFSKARAVKSQFFGFKNFEGQKTDQYVYRLKEGSAVYVTDQSAVHAVTVKSNFNTRAEREAFNSFAEAFNIRLKSALEAENYGYEFFSLFLGREILKSRGDIEQRFNDVNGYFSLIKAFFQVGYDEGRYNMLCYTTDGASLYESRIGITESGVLTHFSDKRIDIENHRAQPR
jgi:hypothetical protein